MNYRIIVGQRFGFTLLMVSLLFLASCAVPAQPVVVSRPDNRTPTTPTTTPVTTTPSVESTPVAKPFELRGGGVGVTFRSQGAQDQRLLAIPVSQVLYSINWESLTASQAYSDLISQPGCVDMVLVKPDLVVGPISLAYSMPAVGRDITPTLWNDLSMFDRPAEDLSGRAITETQIIAAQSFSIDQVIGVTPSDACGVNLIEDEIDSWADISGQNIRQADRVLLTAIQPGGGTTQVLIIINPLSGATCDAAKTACKKCEGCGYEWVCTIVSWAC